MIKSPGLGAIAALVIALCSPAAGAADLAVKITRQLDGISVQHQGQPVRIQRVQDQTNTIRSKFQRTSRKCPPFCIQPMQMPQGVETIGEIEMLDYLQRAAGGDDSVLIIDSRGRDWLRHGTIPGSINIHYKRLSRRASTEADIAAIMQQQFGARRSQEFWDFSGAKTLVLYCNGAWCGQSPTNIRSLLRIGYPAAKLKWYRGGMQSWETLGLTTVTAE